MKGTVVGALRRRSRTVLVALATAFVCGFPPPGQSADWALSEDQLRQVKAGGMIAEGTVIPDTGTAEVRAAVRVNASPETVFKTLTDCSRALRFVPHLKRCVIAETEPDAQVIEQEVDYGLLAPRARYVFRAEYEGFERIRFNHLRGDFKENRGMWEFVAVDEGRATVVTYQARITPAFYVPRWMMRSMLKRDLPELMRGLKTQSEANRPAATTNSGSRPPGP